MAALILRGRNVALLLSYHYHYNNVCIWPRTSDMFMFLDTAGYEGKRI